MGVIMYKYFCVENEKLVSVLDYEPQVPPTVSVVPVLCEHAALAKNGTHFFNPKTKKIVPYPEGKHRDDLFASKAQKPPNPPNPKSMVCVSLNTSSTPEWAKGEIGFYFTKKSDESGVLSVINNTGFVVIASASTNVGEFSDLVIEIGEEYSHECKSSDNPVGFLMFQVTDRKR